MPPKPGENQAGEHVGEFERNSVKTQDAVKKKRESKYESHNNLHIAYLGLETFQIA